MSGLEDLHPLILESSGALAVDEHFAAAIFAAFRSVEERVRNLSGIGDSGRSLMAHAFDENDPALRLNDQTGWTDRDEQEGFKLIFMGAMQGIRNPKAHELIVQTDQKRTLDYLAFASLLMRRLDDAETRL